MTGGGGERRRHPRFAVEKASALFYTTHRAVFARLADISEGGLGVRVPTPFQPGDVLGVKIGGKIQLRARVAWTRGDRPSGMGLELIEILDGEAEFHRLLAEAGAKAP